MPDVTVPSITKLSVRSVVSLFEAALVVLSVSGVSFALSAVFEVTSPPLRLMSMPGSGWSSAAVSV